MARYRTHLDPRSNPERGEASGVAAENMHVRPFRFDALLRLVAGVSVAVVSLALNATHVDAAFVMPDAAKSTAGFLDRAGCSVSILDVLSLCSDPVMSHRPSNPAGGTAGNSTVPVSDSPAVPPQPWGRRSSEMVFPAGFTFGSSERSSTGSSSNSITGGSSGVLGIFASSWRPQGQFPQGWFKLSEFLLIPSAPSSDIFRPPPIAPSQMS